MYICILHYYCCKVYIVGITGHCWCDILIVIVYGCLKINHNNNVLLIIEVIIEIMKIKVILIIINNENSPGMIYTTWYDRKSPDLVQVSATRLLFTNVFILFSSNYYYYTLRYFTWILKNLTVEKFRSYLCWYIKSPGLPVKCTRLFALQLFFIVQILSIFDMHYALQYNVRYMCTGRGS